MSIEYAVRVNFVYTYSDIKAGAGRTQTGGHRCRPPSGVAPGFVPGVRIASCRIFSIKRTPGRSDPVGSFAWVCHTRFRRHRRADRGTWSPPLYSVIYNRVAGSRFRLAPSGIGRSENNEGVSRTGNALARYPEVPGNYLRIAATPGSSLPSMYSSNAPPPVDT